MANNTSAAFFTRVNLIKPVFVNDNHQSDTMASPTPPTVMRSPTENPEKRRKGNKASAFFKRAWKAVKRPFLCCGRNRVAPFEPQSDIDDFEHLPVPGPSRTVAAHADLEPVWLPGQVCEDPQPLSVPGPSRIKQTADPARPESSTALTGHVDTELVCLPGQIWEDPQPISVHGLTNIKNMTDADSACPESPPSVQDPSDIDGTDEKPKKGRKGKRVSAFFKRVWKAATRPFLCCDTDIVQHLTPQPEPETEPESEPEPELEEANPEAVCLPGQVPEEPKEASGPPRGFDLSDFEVGAVIGEGAFGQVFVASHKLRKSEKVALKFINKKEDNHYLDIDGHSTPVLAEVAMMLKLKNAPQCPNIIGLHDWIENENNFILSLEYAESYQTLDQYITDTLDIGENRSRQLMSQLIQAVKFCTEHGVFHGDIHTENIMVTQPQLQLKLIDFGCAWPISSEPFNSDQYRGVIYCTPPEVFRDPTYHADPVNVWTIGIVLYEILHAELPFRDEDSVMFASAEIHPRLSPACQDLISQCFIRCPLERLKLHQLEEHQWFNLTTPNLMELLDARM
ncbi:serine/threonine-protein kinase pim-3 [Danio rerio]|uniref:Serine/threonine-protein kinase pim-3 n=1 Tax=Danio rerio TaxID=7955 RepID=A0AC58GLA7_DANRE